jgi:K+ transporter
VTIIVTVTYVFLVMRADNDGEGGTSDVYQWTPGGFVVIHPVFR